MANITTSEVGDSLATIIAAEALGRLRSNTILSRLVARDWDNEVATHGQTVKIPFRGSLSVNDKSANTVYTFLDFGTNDEAFRILDNLYWNGIKALVTVDENGTGNSNRIAPIVTAYRNHPAILGWVVGNEWNINLYHKKFEAEGYRAAALYTEQLARLVKQLDTNHFVLSTHGDIYPPEMQERIRSLPKFSPLHRVGTEAEVSAAICFLLSPGAAYVSGSCIRVDGAAPNVKPSRPIPNRTPSAEFDGFHLSEKPKVFR